MRQYANFKNNALKDRQKKYLKDKQTSKAHYESLKEEISEKVYKCFNQLLSVKHNITSESIDDINTVADGYAMRYQTIFINHNKTVADNWLREKSGGLIDDDYVFPAVTCPKTRRQWDELAVKRDIGSFFVSLNIAAVKKVLDFDDDKIKLLLNEFNSLYREV